MAIKKIFLDTETTGVNPKKHSIHQLSGFIEIDGERVETFNIEMQPHPKAQIEPEALKTCGKTEEELRSRPLTFAQGYKEYIKILSRHVDRFDKRDKLHVVGYNAQHFDNEFIRMMFALNDDDYYGSWFYSACVDVMALAAEYLIERRVDMPDFKLGTVAAELGLFLDESKLHDALYDVETTEKVYNIVTGREIEL